MVLPSAYKRVETPSELYEEGTQVFREEVRNRIRILYQNFGRDKAYYLFEPNEEYEELRDQLRQDSKALMHALDRKLKASGLPYRALLRGEGKGKSGIPIKLFLSPPMLTSLQEKNGLNRKHWSRDCIDLVLHVDMERNIMMVRHSVVGRKKEEVGGPEQDLFLTIYNERAFFKEHYGDWDAIADKIVEILRAA